MSAHPTKRRVITVIDIGSTKITCLIAKVGPTNDGTLYNGRPHRIEIAGIGHQRSRGIKSGVLIDLDLAEQAIRMAVDTAERMAQVTVESVVVNLSGGRLKSRSLPAQISLGGHAAGKADVTRVLLAGMKQVMDTDREVVHAMPSGFNLDGQAGIRDPRGMVGEQLGVDMHVLTADEAAMRNLELCINRCHLSVAHMVATPFASGLAALVADEMDMGSVCIDIGGGTTSLGVFHNRKFIHGSVVPVGGRHITLDLARGLSTSLEDAERLKVMYGSALPTVNDDQDLVNFVPMGAEEGDGPSQIPRGLMTRIVRARVEEILEYSRDQLAKSGHSQLVGKRIVLTGGTSQMQGLQEVARRVFGRSVRIGRPLGVARMPVAAKGAAFSTAAGLMIYPLVREFEIGRETSSRSGLFSGSQGPLRRMGQWIKQSF